MKMPEEVNRILTDRISDILFCPTDTAIENLDIEGYAGFDNDVVRCGDVMQDAALYYAKTSESKSKVIDLNGLEKCNFCLVTIHRAENTDDPERLQSIFSALNRINKESRVVLPLHPRTKKILAELDIKTDVTIIDPVGYFDMIELLKNCEFVMTDSGGFNTIVGADTALILSAYKSLGNSNPDFSKDLYGQGAACSNIVASIKNLMIEVGT